MQVYNITPYLKFHPGGSDILLKAAGKDGTLLFMKYHPWVNIDALMEKCLIGLSAEHSHQPNQQVFSRLHQAAPVDSRGFCMQSLWAVYYALLMLLYIQTTVLRPVIMFSTNRSAGN